MENDKIIMQEIMELAPLLASINRQMPYTLPEGYFDVFPVEMLSSVAPKKAGFSVPEGYFENLPAQLLAKVRASAPVAAEAESDENRQLLDRISKKMPYSVPPRYFEEFAVDLPGRGAPVVPVWRPLRKAMGWAVAASIIAVVGLFGYRFLNRGAEDVAPETTVTMGVASTENNVEENIIAAELAEALSAVDDNHLKAELEGYNSADKSVVHYYTTNNIEKALKTVSVDEIKKSLELEGYIYMKS